MILEGSGGSEFEGIVDANYLKIHLSGGGKAELDINCDELNAKGTGGSTFEFDGEVMFMNLTLSGGGKCEGYDLYINESSVDLSGGSKATVTVSDYISGDLSGGSELKYKGNAGTDVYTSGGSRVVHVN